jgi:hypothetical protein
VFAFRMRTPATNNWPPQFFPHMATPMDFRKIEAMWMTYSGFEGSDATWHESTKRRSSAVNLAANVQSVTLNFVLYVTNRDDMYVLWLHD